MVHMIKCLDINTKYYLQLGQRKPGDDVTMIPLYIENSWSIITSLSKTSLIAPVALNVSITTL